MIHERTLCEICFGVIAQCRCPGPHPERLIPPPAFHVCEKRKVAAPDLHGHVAGAWIGVDLDGTLAHYDGWRGGEHIGEPIPMMLARVLVWIENGKDVRIFTARCHSTSPEWEPDGRTALELWMIKHLGTILPVTSQKDGRMIELWDDRAIQVIKNTGQRVDGGN